MFIDGAEQGVPLSGLADVGVNKQAVDFGMDVFHHSLKGVEISCFRYLHFLAESGDKVLIDNGIRGCEESENGGYDVSFVVG